MKTTPEENTREVEEIVNLKEWHELQGVLDAIWQGRPIHTPDIDLLERLSASIHQQLQKAREEERQNAYAHADIVRRRMTLEVVEGIKEHYDLSGYIDGVIESLDHSTLDQNTTK